MAARYELVGLVVVALGASCHRGDAVPSTRSTAVAAPPSAPLPEPAPESSGPKVALGADRLTPEAGLEDPLGLAIRPVSSAVFPFGPPAPIATYSCPVVLSGGPFRAFLADADTRVAFVDGDDLLALVNRSPTGALPPSYAPRDLVDLRDLSPRRAAACETGRACLRRDAAVALRDMFQAMRAEGLVGRVDSAYRGFGTQCWVFDGWAAKARGGFCEAATQSALPGHSQHQLGTTVDAFTSDWAEQGTRTGEGVFRNGFGCTRGGKWFDDNAYRYGFVVPYPIDPEDRKDSSRCQVRADRPVPIDPKTGYKHEPWHLRFIGVDAAARFHAAWLESGPGTANEITLEQWLRARRGLSGDTELPVCDGCQCGACATMEDGKHRNPCGDAAILIDASGRVLAPREEPRLLEARAKRAARGGWLVEIRLSVPPHTPTQPPVADEEGLLYPPDSTYRALVPYDRGLAHDYEDLPGAWRVALAYEGARAAPAWPWRASLAEVGLGETWNRANVVLPGQAGDHLVRIEIPASASNGALRVTLLRDGTEHGTRAVLMSP